MRYNKHKNIRIKNSNVTSKTNIRNIAKGQNGK